MSTSTAATPTHRLHWRVLRPVLGVQAHALLVDANLAFDAGAALGLLQPHGVLALAGLFLFPGRGGPVPLRRAACAPRRLGRRALLLPSRRVGLGAGAGLVLLLLDPVVLDPAQLPQRKQNRVCLTWTFGHGYLSSAAQPRSLINFRNTIRHRVQRNCPALGRTGRAKDLGRALKRASAQAEGLLVRREQLVDNVVALLLAGSRRASCRRPAWPRLRPRSACCRPWTSCAAKTSASCPRTSAGLSAAATAFGAFFAAFASAIFACAAAWLAWASAWRAFAASATALASAVRAAITACLRASSASSIER